MNRYPEAYIEYLVYFHIDRDYFECHEVLEEYWKEHPEDPNRPVILGLIQVAVSLYHQRRGNLAGAVKMLASAVKGLRTAPVESLGLKREELLQRLEGRLAELGNPAFTYTDLNLPLADEVLPTLCREAAAERAHLWEHPSDLTNTYLLNKHTLRDRSDVVAEREAQRLARLQRRGNGPAGAEGN